MSNIISPSGGSVAFPYYDAVKDFASVGDGVTDNRAALQSALTTLVSTGGDLFIPAGTYMLSRSGLLSLSMSLAKKWRIRGVPGKTILKHQSGMPASSVVVLKLDRCEDGILEDIILDGNWGNAATKVAEASHGVALPTGTISVRDTTDFPSSGTIYAYSSKGRQAIAYTGKTATTFTGCTGGSGSLVRDFNVGLEPTQAGINHGTYTDPKNYALFDRGCERLIIQRCRFQQVYGDAIWMGGSDTDPERWARDTRIINCHFDMCARNAITVAGGPSIGTIIDGCKSRNIYSQSVDSEPVVAPCRDVVVRANDFGCWWDPDGRSNPPISVVGGGGSAGSTDALNWRVHDNVLRGTTYMERCKDVVFERNRVLQDFATGGSSGVLVQVECDDITIRDNFFYTRSSVQLSINTKIAPASNGAALPTGTISVDDASSYASSGTFYVNIAGVPTLITYTGTTATSFTGCTGGTGTLKTGQLVTTVDSSDVNGSGAAIAVFNYGFGQAMATPAGIRIHDNQIYARNGRSGINIQSSGGQSAVDGFTLARVTGTATAVNTVSTDIAAASDAFNIPFAEVALASNGQALGAGPFTINVDDTTNFAASGNIIVKIAFGNYQTVAYTGKTSTSFTGCTGGTGTLTTGMDISQSYTINVVDASGFASSGLTYVRTTTQGYQIVRYTGTTANSLTGCFGGAGRLNTGNDVYQTLVTDSTQSWAEDNSMSGLYVTIGGVRMTIIDNNATQLLARQSDASHRLSWQDGLAQYAASPGVGQYVITRPTGVVDVAGNTIDLTDDGPGPGSYGINTDFGQNGLPGARLRFRNNVIKNASGPAIRIGFSTAAPYDLLEITDNLARDAQAIPTATACVAFRNTPNVATNAWVMRGNNVDKSVPALITGLTSGRWLVANGNPAMWAGYGTPEGNVIASVGSLYTRVDGGASSTLYVKESGSGNTGWAAAGSAAPQAPAFVAQCLLAGANFDLAISNTAGGSMGNGILWLTKVRSYNASFDKVLVETTTQAAGATNIFVGIYKSDGTQTAAMSTATVDAKTDFQATIGLKTITLTNSVSVTPGDDIYVAILPVGTSTPPAIRQLPNGNSNLGLPASQGFRSASFSSGLVAMPASVALSSMASVGNMKFAAIK